MPQNVDMIEAASHVIVFAGGNALFKDKVGANNYQKINNKVHLKNHSDIGNLDVLNRAHLGILALVQYVYSLCKGKNTTIVVLELPPRYFYPCCNDRFHFRTSHLFINIHSACI